ncbi:MAG: YkgJ family cysteine cluster protein [Myxococcota bacterium]
MSDSPTCQRCGCCCHQRPGTILVTAEDIATWRCIGRHDLIEALTEGHFGEMAMPMGPDGACRYLGRPGAPNECSIYEVRARVCRDFEAGCSQCEEFRRR